MKKFNESADNNDWDLDLPDWSGMDDSAARVSPAAAFAFLEQYYVWWSQCAKPGFSCRPEKCMVEFVL